MKTKLLTILLIFIVALPLMAAPPYKSRTERPMSAVVDNATYINANKILMFVTNHANFCRDLSGVFGHDAGTFYPYVDDASINDGSLDDYILYASGLWVGGLVNGETRVAVAEYSDEYVPGPMDEFVSATGNDTTWTFNAGFDTDPAYKVYKLYSDSMADHPNADWTNWPVGDGAPVDDQGDPDMIGDQMLWAVYNDANPDAHDNGSGETLPLGIEIRQTTWAFDREDALGEIIFIRFQVFNKGGNTIEDCHFSLWCDPDLGEYTDDLVGCFVEEDLGYVYNSDNDDANHYFDKPPAVGYDFFQGPLMFTGIDTDSAKMWGQKWGGYLNMGMTSFNKYINGTDPNNFNETFNYMRGLQANGDPYEFPLGSGEVTKYMHAGDPTAGTGDIDFDPADRRWMQTTGPITFAPGDSTEFVAAIVVGQAIDRLTSISLMKFHDKFAQIAYDADFELPEPPATPILTASFMNEGISLSWTDTSEVDHGTYPFEGYIVWQGETSTGPWTQVAALDLANSIVNIFDEVFDPITAVPEIRLVKKGGDLGVKHHIFIEEDHVLGGPLRNITKYFYKVEAYTVDQSQELGFKTLTSAAQVSVRPQRPVADEDWSAFFGDTLDADHVAGISQGQVIPIIVDHYQLTGHDYQVTFEALADTVITPNPPDPDDTTITEWTVWNLVDLDTGDSLIIRNTNLSGDDDYEIVDGILWKVTGPPVDFLSFEVVANADGPIDPPEAGAFPWPGFPVPTGVDPDGYPTDGQQVGDGLWGFHTADNGGTNDGGTRGSYAAFLDRATRSGDNFEEINSFDYEMRFTGTNDDPGTGGGYAIEWFNDDNVFWVPFELWNIGIGTPDDVSDDYRLVAYIIDDAGPAWEGDDIYSLESWGDSDNGGGDWEHSVSGGNNDPFTDWVYWENPTDNSPGEAGYLANEAEMLAGTFAANLIAGEVLARTVLVSWNGGSEPPFTQDCPEQGTIFRLVTTKPNFPADTFVVNTDVLTVNNAEAVLDNITVAPNPFYLYGPYDPAVGNYQIMFQNLPTECTITLYNLAGEFVYEIEKNDPTTSTASWGANTANGLPVASGIYLWVVDAPGIGQKVGKIAVFTEVELLQTY